MIEFRNVSKDYYGHKAVNTISFQVKSGEVCMLIGPSGCGKTTTLRMINRLIEPSAGDILMRNRSVRELAAEELRRGIGYVIQSVGLLPHLNVRDNIGIVPRLLKWSREKRYQRAEELLQLVALDPEIYSTKYPHQLSGGEAQRIGVARALAADPEILLMDEPFGAVDPLRREVLQNEFLRLQRKLKKTVLFVTHDLDEAIRPADHIILMDQGTIIQNDTPERILAQPANQFVRDFVGGDRALKRLACFQVADYVQDTMTRTHSELQNGSNHEVQTVWLVDEEQRLAGIIRPDPSNGSPAVIPLSTKSVGVSHADTLRDALSRILGHGLPAVPVVDQEARVVGEVRLPDIEEVNQDRNRSVSVSVEAGARAGIRSGRIAAAVTGLLIPIAAVILFTLLLLNQSILESLLHLLFPNAVEHLYDRGTLGQFLLQHIAMVVVSSCAATIVGVSLGAFVTRESGREFLPLIRNIASLAQTFPPVAVLVLAAPALGFGFKPTILALFIYSILPVLNNTIAGLESVPANLIEASRGMGMTRAQVLMMSEFPLAARVIVAGIRTSIIINIGTATVGAVAGAGGLGVIIIAGLVRNNPAFTFSGAATAALLALFSDWLLSASNGSSFRHVRALALGTTANRPAISYFSAFPGLHIAARFAIVTCYPIMRNRLRIRGGWLLFRPVLRLLLGSGLALLVPAFALAQTAWDSTIVSARTQDDNSNGFIDRIEIEAPAALNDSAAGSYSSVVVQVESYIVTGVDSCGVSGDQQLCAYVTEKTIFDSAVRPRVRVQNSGGLRFVGAGASASSNEVLAADGVSPTVGYTLSLAGRNEIYIRFSEPVYSDTIRTPLNSSVFSLNIDPARMIVSVRNGDGGSGGTQNALLVLDDDILAVHLFDPSPGTNVTITSSIYDSAGNQISGAVGMPISQLFLSDVENALLLPAVVYNSLAPADVIDSGFDQPAVGILRRFDGSRAISPDPPIILQVSRSLAVTALPEIIAGTDVDPRLIRNNLWLPIAVPDLVPASNGETINLTGAADTETLVTYRIEEEHLAGGDTQFEFFLRIGGDYFAAIIDSESDDWYTQVRPYSFAIRSVGSQRSGISILNNVINPRNDERTSIQYRLDRTASVAITVFNLTGDIIRVLQRGTQQSGTHIVEWDGRNSRGRPVARGLYFIRFVSSDTDEYRKVIIIR